MNKFITRSKLCEALRLSPETSTKAFPARGRLPISEREVVSKLNACRVSLPRWEGEGLPEVESVGDVVRRQVVTINGRPATTRQIQAMCRRIHNPIPHFRIGAATFLFPVGAVDWWLSLIGSGMYVSKRKYQYGALPYDPNEELLKQAGVG